MTGPRPREGQEVPAEALQPRVETALTVFLHCRSCCSVSRPGGRPGGPLPVSIVCGARCPRPGRKRRSLHRIHETALGAEGRGGGGGRDPGGWPGLQAGVSSGAAGRMARPSRHSEPPCLQTVPGSIPGSVPVESGRTAVLRQPLPGERPPASVSPRGCHSTH